MRAKFKIFFLKWTKIFEKSMFHTNYSKIHASIAEYTLKFALNPYLSRWSCMLTNTKIMANFVKFHSERDRTFDTCLHRNFLSETFFFIRGDELCWNISFLCSSSETRQSNNFYNYMSKCWNCVLLTLDESNRIHFIEYFH